MPSSKKTPNLFLNNWLGSDKPKKDDFNEDNQIVDQSIGALNTRLNLLEDTAEQLVSNAAGDWSGQLSEATGAWTGKLETEVKNWGTKLDTASQAWDTKLAGAKSELNTQLSGTRGELDTQIQGVSGSLTSHAASTVLHVTASEKAAWNSTAPIVGSYTGNGVASRTISLGYAPRAGIVFAASMPPVMMMWSTQACYQYATFFSSAGSAAGAAATTGGFTVSTGTAGSDGIAYKLNENGFPYVYIVWK